MFHRIVLFLNRKVLVLFIPFFFRLTEACEYVSFSTRKFLLENSLPNTFHADK